MAARRRKPGKYPDWLFDVSVCFPGRRMCLWLCSGCGSPSWYAQLGKRHGGPAMRIVDHPEWSPKLGPCWRSSDYGVKCVTPKALRVLYHEGSEKPTDEQMREYASLVRKRARQMKEE